jgi:hypothetical protein
MPVLETNQTALALISEDPPSTKLNWQQLRS